MLSTFLFTEVHLSSRISFHIEIQRHSFINNKTNSSMWLLLHNELTLCQCKLIPRTPMVRHKSDRGLIDMLKSSGTEMLISAIAHKTQGFPKVGMLRNMLRPHSYAYMNISLIISRTNAHCLCSK